MTNWKLRGLVFTAAMIVVRLVQGALVDAFPTHTLLASLSLLALVVIAVVIWALIDGRADARANPDPDRREDLAMTWLLTGLASGALSGLVMWIIAMFYKKVYTGGLLQEVTTFAAFTALLIFLPAMGAVATGRWLVDRQTDTVPQKHHGLAADDGRTDTDVFAAARGDQSADESPTGEIAVAQPEARTAVATVEHDDRTQEAATEVIEQPTQEIKTTQFDPERTQPTSLPKDKR